MKIRLLLTTIFISVGLVPLNSRARDTELGSGMPEPAASHADEVPHWSDGIRIIAGIGLNSSALTSGHATTTAGIGSNLRSDVGYYFGNGYGVEFSGSVMFNSLKDSLLWNTTLAAGLRFGLPARIVRSFDNLAPYGRVMIGRTTNVEIFSGKVPERYTQNNANRLQGEGEMIGAGVGFFQRSSTGRIWYTELTLERHSIYKVEAITDVGGVPVVLGDASDGGRSVLYALCLTFGIMAF